MTSSSPPNTANVDVRKGKKYCCAPAICATTFCRSLLPAPALPAPALLVPALPAPALLAPAPPAAVAPPAPAAGPPAVAPEALWGGRGAPVSACCTGEPAGAFDTVDAAAGGRLVPVIGATGEVVVPAAVLSSDSSSPTTPLRWASTQASNLSTAWGSFVRSSRDCVRSVGAVQAPKATRSPIAPNTMSAAETPRGRRKRPRRTADSRSTPAVTASPKRTPR